jgi:DNA-binding response OmpR family regulator
VLSREQILNHVWGYDFMADTNVVDVYIRYLRKKVDYQFNSQLIQTIRGVGYVIKDSSI